MLSRGGVRRGPEAASLLQLVRLRSVALIHQLFVLRSSDGLARAVGPPGGSFTCARPGLHNGNARGSGSAPRGGWPGAAVCGGTGAERLRAARDAARLVGARGSEPPLRPRLARRSPSPSAGRGRPFAWLSLRGRARRPHQPAGRRDRDHCLRPLRPPRSSAPPRPGRAPTHARRRAGVCCPRHRESLCAAASSSDPGVLRGEGPGGRCARGAVFAAGGVSTGFRVPGCGAGLIVRDEFDFDKIAPRLEPANQMVIASGVWNILT